MALLLTRKPKDERDAKHRIEHRARMTASAVLSECLAVVPDDDHDRRIRQTRGAQAAQEPLEKEVHESDLAVVVLLLVALDGRQVGLVRIEQVEPDQRRLARCSLDPPQGFQKRLVTRTLP
jgi:hypothetical protein